MKIGVFDSGVGGLSVALAIQEAIPEHEVLFINDSKNVPYGTKSPDKLLGLVMPMLQLLVDQGCQVIVIACNTVTTTLITELRQGINVPLIGMEPMIKPAAVLSKNGVVAVCATPTTLMSKRYQWLKTTYASGVSILEPDCSDWSYMIESKRIDRQLIQDRIDSVCSEGADVIVLGCTHYHWIKEIIEQTAAGRAVVLQPETPVIAQLKRVLKQLA